MSPTHNVNFVNDTQASAQPIVPDDEDAAVDLERVSSNFRQAGLRHLILKGLHQSLENVVSSKRSLNVFGND